MSRQSLSDALAKDRRAPSPAADTATGTESSGNYNYVPPSRRGKRRIMVHVEPEVLRQLKELGLELGDRSTQSMVVEALNDFFVKNGRSPLAS